MGWQNAKTNKTKQKQTNKKTHPTTTEQNTTPPKYFILCPVQQREMQ